MEKVILGRLLKVDEGEASTGCWRDINISVGRLRLVEEQRGMIWADAGTFPEQ